MKLKSKILISVVGGRTLPSQIQGRNGLGHAVRWSVVGDLSKLRRLGEW